MTRKIQNRRHHERALSGDGSGQDAAPLALLVFAATVLAVMLWQVSGPPPTPSGVLEWGELRRILTASELSDGNVIAVAATVAWLALAYLAVTIVIRFLVVIAVRLTGGARWARTALRLTNVITVPAVRRTVDGGIAGTLLLASWLPNPSRVVTAAEPSAVVAAGAVPASASAAIGERHDRQAVRFVEYTVVHGDALWDIARRFYGDGSRYVEVWEQNRDREMVDGERFVDPRVLRSGWVLQVSLPAQNVSVDQGVVSYRVTQGDDLWSIAARLLGDGLRWTEIWERNRGREMGGGWRFTDPNLIYAGWRLELPAVISDTAAPPPPAGTPTASAPLATPTVAPTDVADGGAPDAPIGADDEDAGGGLGWEWPAIPQPLMITAAGFAVIGGAVLFVQRLRQAGLLRLPAHSGRLKSGDAGRVALVSRAFDNALGDLGFADARTLLVHESGSRLRFAVHCPAGDAETLLARRHDLGRRLDCQAQGEVFGSARVEFTLSDAGGPPMELGAATSRARTLVVPVGADADGSIVYLDIAGAGNVAVSGGAAEQRQLLRGWLVTLASISGPDNLSFRGDDATARLLGDAVELPHFAGAGTPGTVELIEELEDVIQSRPGGVAGRPLVAVLSLDAGHRLPLQSLLRYGPAAGVFVLAVSPADEIETSQGAFAASLTFAEPSEDSDLDSPGGPQAITLTIGADERFELESVLVRRDTSSRWHEHAQVTGRIDDGLANERVTDLPNRDGFVEPSHAGSTGSFDWRRAVFDPHSVNVEGEDRAGESAIASRGLDTGMPQEAPRGELRSVADPLDASDARAAEVAKAAGKSESLPVEQEEADHASNRCEEREADDEPASAGVREQEQASRVQTAPRAVRQPALLAPKEPTSGEEQEQVDSGALIEVRGLGPFEVSVQGVPVTSWHYEKGRELLAFLVAHGGAPVPREVLAEALWPGYPWDASTQHLIHNAVSTLRTVIRSVAGTEAQPLTFSKGRYQLQRGLFRADLDAFEDLLRRGASLPGHAALDEYEQALALYRGDFLEAENFAWQETYRDEYRRRFVEGANHAGRIASEVGEWERALTFYQASSRVEPTNEDAGRGVMRCFAALGDPNGARKTYRVLAEALQEELGDGAAPSRETQELLTQVTTEATVG